GGRPRGAPDRGWVGGGSPCSYPAVPVLPARWAPGTAAAVPLPSATTRRISPNSVSDVPAASAVGSGAPSVASSGSSTGGSHVPSSTVAPTVAMCSGLASSLHWPLVAAAFLWVACGRGE